MDLQYLAHICCLVFLLHPTSTKKASSPHCSSTTRAEWDCLQGLSTGCIEGVYRMKMLNYCHEIFGYGSIPINTIFNGMNIHLPAILMFTRGTRFWHTATWAIHCMSIVSPGFFLGTINLWDLLMFFFTNLWKMVDLTQKRTGFWGALFQAASHMRKLMETMGFSIPWYTGFMQSFWSMVPHLPIEEWSR